jgi:hypothetical protein
LPVPESVELSHGFGRLPFFTHILALIGAGLASLSSDRLVNAVRHCRGSRFFTTMLAFAPEKIVESVKNPIARAAHVRTFVLSISYGVVH